MENVKRIKIFVGGTGNFKEKKKYVEEIITEFIKDYGEVEDRVSFVIIPPNRPEDEPPPDKEQEKTNNYAKLCDIMFMFFEDGLGTVTDDIEKRIYKTDAGFNIYKEVLDQYESLKSRTTCTGSVEEILNTLVKNNKASIYTFFKEPENQKIKDIKRAFISTGKITNMNYNNIPSDVLKNAIFSYFKNIYDQAKKQAKRDLIEVKRTSHPIVFPKDGKSPYSEMSEILDKTTYLLSLNFKNDLPKPREFGPRSKFLTELEKRMTNYATRCIGSPLHFTRISSFTNIKKLLEALNEVERVFNTVLINLIYYPYLHLHRSSNGEQISSTEETETKDASKNPLLFSDNYEEHASLVLFGNEQDKYDFGIWGLFGDNENDGRDSSAILYPDLDEFDPISEYGTNLKSYFEKIAPLCISFPDIVIPKTKKRLDHSEFKKDFEGFYPSNFNVLMKMLEIDNNNHQKKSKDKSFKEELNKAFGKDLDKLCKVCKKIKKTGIIPVRQKLNPLFERICTDINRETLDNVKCIDCKIEDE